MTDRMDAGFAWQVDVWDRMAEVYQREIASRFGPVIEHLMARADPRPGEAILDLGTGTGSVAIVAAARIAASLRSMSRDVTATYAITGVAERRTLAKAPAGVQYPITAD